MRALWVTASIAILFVSPVLAEEPVGCDKFKWPVEKEMTALRASHLQEIKSGTKLSGVPFVATLVLIPSDTANLPAAPERAPKDNTFSGYLSMPDIAAGTYSIGLSDAAWVDVVQDGRFLKLKAHSGVQGCRGIRKVFQFELGADPITIQVSDDPHRG